MKKFFFFAALICAHISWAETSVVPSTTLTTYYETINGKSGEDIRSALNSKIRPHTTISYDNLRYIYQYSDTYDAKGTVIEDIYSYCDPAYTTDFCDGTCGYNREHSVPKSWFNEATPLYSDAFHLYPTNCYVNSNRGNYAYGECADGEKCTTNGVQAKGRRGLSTFVSEDGTNYSSVGTVFEPDDEYKGDLARTYFYMVTCYMTQKFNYADGGVKMFEYTNGTAYFTQYSIDLLMKWHRQDPVSKKELIRNEVIYGNSTYNKSDYKQGNRNPFIDYPQLAEYLWGNKQGQSVDLATLVSAYSGDTVPPIPPTPTIKHGVTWSINGEEAQVDSIKENNKVTTLPDEPTSCSTESNVFVGWTTAPISGTSDDAPAVLYKTANQMPAVTADVTYYAVFAKQTTTQSSQVESTETIDLSTGFADKQEVTSVSGSKVTLTFDGGTNNNKPKYYTNGNAVRLYGSNSMTVTANNITGIVLTYGSNDGSNPISTNVGTFSTDTWTGSANAVIFTVGGASGNRRIASVAVTTNGAGSTTAYSRYITSCQTTTEVAETQAENVSARKILVGGQIYLQIGDNLYNITGQRMK